MECENQGRSGSRMSTRNVEKRLHERSGVDVLRFRRFKNLLDGHCPNATESAWSIQITKSGTAGSAPDSSFTGWKAERNNVKIP